MLSASPTLLGSLVWNLSAKPMNVMAWVIRGGRKRMLYVVFRKAASIADLALTFFRGVTVQQISGSCAAVLELHSRKRLLRSDPHCSAGVSA